MHVRKHSMKLTVMPSAEDVDPLIYRSLTVTSKQTRVLSLSSRSSQMALALTEGKAGDRTRRVDMVMGSATATGQSPTFTSSQAGGNLPGQGRDTPPITPFTSVVNVLVETADTKSYSTETLVPR